MPELPDVEVYKRIIDTKALNHQVDQFNIYKKEIVCSGYHYDDWKEKFYKAIEPIRKKTGAILWQLPPNLHKDIEKLKYFCQNLNNSYFANVIEFRHESWFSQEVYNILKEHNVTLCSISSPDELPEKLIDSKRVYLRLHGINNWYKDNYPEKVLRSWVEKILRLDADQAFVFFNNDHNAYAVQNAKTFQQMILQN